MTPASWSRWEESSSMQTEKNKHSSIVMKCVKISSNVRESESSLLWRFSLPPQQPNLISFVAKQQEKIWVFNSQSWLRHADVRLIIPLKISKKRMRLELKILLVSLFANSISASSQPAVMSSSSHHNESENRVIRRQKRFFPLVFPGGGTAKFVSEFIQFKLV